MNYRHILLISACTAFTWLPLAQASAKTVHVVTSFTVLQDVVQNVGGTHVDVKSLVPANGDPHEYEPSPADAIAVKNADVTFLSGEGLETWFARLAKASGAPHAPVMVSAGIKTHQFNEDGHEVTDPHVWNNVANVMVWVSNIEQALSKADPDDAAIFRHNADQYRKQLQTLDSLIRADIATVPKANRHVLTSHDAFGYYQQAYGIRFLSPLGLSTEHEASAADVAALISQIRQEKIRVYFLENSNDSRLVKQIANATGAVAGGELYPEALSDKKGPAGTYVQLMTFNTRQMVQAMSALPDLKHNH